jgi:hypothetical protein
MTRSRSIDLFLFSRPSSCTVHSKH